MPKPNNRKDKIMDPEQNPCWKEAGLSQGCMNRNHFKSELCGEEFENYRNCKKFWLFVERQRMKTQTRPFLPPPDEREASIKAHLSDFMKQR